MVDAQLSEERMNISFEEPDVDRSKDQGGDSDELSGLSCSDGDVTGTREGSDGDGDDKKRKKRRRGKHKGGKHHRKWRPYTQLSWTERQEVDARETARAKLKREEAFASGHPVAPYNTTQFLIDDHIQSEVSPDLNREFVRKPHSAVIAHSKIINGTNAATASGVPQVETVKADDISAAAATTVVPDDLLYSSSGAPTPNVDEEDRFLAKEFSTTYDILHLERLQSMSKEELVKECLELEKKVERLEKNKPCNKVGNKDGDRESSDSLCSNNEEYMDLNYIKGDDA